MSRPERRSAILGTGSEIPSTIVTNHDIEKIVDTSDEWITVRTGIKERHVLEDGKGNADMAYEAAKRALDDAQVDDGGALPAQVVHGAHEHLDDLGIRGLTLVGKSQDADARALQPVTHE